MCGSSAAALRARIDQRIDARTTEDPKSAAAGARRAPRTVPTTRVSPIQSPFPQTKQKAAATWRAVSRFVRGKREGDEEEEDLAREIKELEQEQERFAARTVKIKRLIVWAKASGELNIAEMAWNGESTDEEEEEGDGDGREESWEEEEERRRKAGATTLEKGDGGADGADRAGGGHLSGATAAAAKPGARTSTHSPAEGPHGPKHHHHHHHHHHHGHSHYKKIGQQAVAAGHSGHGHSPMQAGDAQQAGRHSSGSGPHSSGVATPGASSHGAGARAGAGGASLTRQSSAILPGGAPSSPGSGASSLMRSSSRVGRESRKNQYQDKANAFRTSRLGGGSGRRHVADRFEEDSADIHPDISGDGDSIERAPSGTDLAGTSPLGNSAGNARSRPQAVTEAAHDAAPLSTSAAAEAASADIPENIAGPVSPLQDRSLSDSESTGERPRSRGESILSLTDIRPSGDWQRTLSSLAVPPTVAEQLDEDSHVLAGTAPSRPPPERSGSSKKMKPKRELTLLEKMERKAVKEIGFLFEQYQVVCWYWELVELLRKLVLTSVLSFVARGSASQVTVGVMICFVMVMVVGKLRPYSNPSTNSVAMFAQISLFLFLFVALLLKVKMDSVSPDGKFFNMLVQVLSIATPLCPVAIKALSVLSEDMGDSMEGVAED